MMRLLALAAVLMLAVAIVVAAPAASAHEIAVLPPGSGELDAGTGAVDRLVHATLDASEDELVVTTRGGGQLVQLLVPDRGPEDDFRRGALPSLDASPASAVASAADVVSIGDVRRDEVTGIEYRVIDARLMSAPDDVTTTLRIRRGAEPVRVALWVGSPTGGFDAVSLDRTPRALVLLREWAETPAPSSSYVPPAPKTEPRTRVAGYGAGIALLGVLIGVWWIGAGWRRSRERGAERAGAERND